MAISTRNKIARICFLMEIIDLWGKQALQKQLDNKGYKENSYEDTVRLELP